MGKDNKYPLFPELTEQGRVEAQELINKFKDELLKAAEGIVEKAMGDFYCDIIPYIESDSWTNFRNELMDGFKNYSNKRVTGVYDFKSIREEILNQFRDDIIKDLNQDYLEEIASLRKQIELMRNQRY